MNIQKLQSDISAKTRKLNIVLSCDHVGREKIADKLKSEIYEREQVMDAMTGDSDEI